VSSECYPIKELYNLFVQFPFICTDTRNIIPDSLFFCLKGNHFDGNLFVNEALEKGAKYVVTERNHKQNAESKKIKEKAPYSDKIIVVDNVLKTLQQLANYHRRQLPIPIIGITGSNGKTTTKELIAAVLSKKYKVAYTQGNLNNHIGVPLTLLSIKKDDQMAVIEMGANHPGEIEELCQIAQPDYGLITNIGKAHLEGFGSMENIIKTKTALYQAAKMLFVNNEDELLMQKAEGRKQKRNSPPLKKPRGGLEGVTATDKQESLSKKSNIIYYGANTEFSGQIVDMNPCLVINLFGKRIQTRLAGQYNLPNILGAVAIGRFFNISTDDIGNALSEYTPQHNRSQIIENKNNTIIADCYNANPTSMKAALENFLQLEAPHKLAILGDMLELGENSLCEHQAIIDFCKLKNIDVIFIGENFFKLKDKYSPQFFKTVEECNHYLKNNKLQNRLVLMKGSRGVHLEDVALSY